MRRPAFDEVETIEAERVPNVSGVHSASTQPAPFLEEPSPTGLVGSIPIEDLAVEFQVIANLHTGQTHGHEVLPRCLRDELADPVELFARASFEKTVGELGRAIRTLAVRECPGTVLYLPVHPAELKDRYLVRPDDPMYSHDAPVFLQLSQGSLAGIAALVIEELRARSGVSLALDDFGVGPATLQQLIEIEPAAVKLDRELSSGLHRSLRKQIVVRTLVAMCDALGARLIAKGLDSSSELSAAIDCGIVYGQGSALGDPASLPLTSTWPPSR